MSDTPQGPGWWQASDGKFYPPQSQPAAPAAPPSPAPGQPPAAPGAPAPGAPAPGGYEPQYGAQNAPGFGAPVAPGPVPGQWTPPPTPPKKGGMPGWAIALIVVGLLMLLLIGGCVAAIAALGRSAENIVEEVGEAFDELNAIDDSSCRFVELDGGGIGAEVTVMNTTAAVSDYDFSITNPASAENDFIAGFPFEIERVAIGELRTERTGALALGELTIDDAGTCRLQRAFRSESN